MEDSEGSLNQNPSSGLGEGDLGNKAVHQSRGSVRVGPRSYRKRRGI